MLTLMNLTRDVYGSKYLLESYRKKSKLFLQDMRETGKIDFYYQESIQILNEYQYSIFSSISSIVPTYQDIIKALNQKILSNISSNIDLYLESITSISQVFEYMKSTDIVSFYHEFKHILTTVSLKKKTYSKIIILQEEVCKYLSDLLEIPIDEVLVYYLKEEKIF